MSLPLFDGDLRTARCTLCVYDPSCGHRMTIGPCEPSELSCQHALVCLTCGARGVQSWNLTLAAKAHAKAIA